MALLIPDLPNVRTDSERVVFTRLEHDLDEDWIVLHSLNLLQQRNKLAGEADFVVISTKGIFVIEVKGSRRVSCQNGIWQYGTPGSSRYLEKRESPFVQAKDAMFEVQRILGENPSFKDLLIGYGVVMPYAIFSAQGPEIEQGVLLDAREFSKNLGFYIGQLARHWDQTYRNKHGRARRMPGRTELKAIRQQLRPDLESTPGLATIFNGLEERLLALTNQQVRALRGMENNPRTLVIGRAGTGKTVIAIDRAVRLAAAGARVQYLCFNQLLARHVTAAMAGRAGASNVQVRHIHGLFHEVISKANLTARLQEIPSTDEKDFYGRVFPEVFFEAAVQIDHEPADVLIVDEAQDLLTPEMLTALDVLVRDGLDRGRWSLFLDPLQDIYGAQKDRAMSILKQAGYAQYELIENCRNTREVATQGSIISGIDVAIESAIPGVSCDCIYYKDRSELGGRIEAEVKKLIAGGVPVKDIVILSSVRRENSAIAGMTQIGGSKIQDLAESVEADNTLHFWTMHAFKRLEGRVVLAIDLESLGAEHMKLLHYAGLSRAITLLCPFIPISERTAYELQARRYGERIPARA